MELWWLTISDRNTKDHKKEANKMKPILYIVIPCYNEQEVLPVTAPEFLKKIKDLTVQGKISD